MSTWSTPSRSSDAAFAGSRVVESTVMPLSLPSTAMAMPTDEVPPRISSVCPAVGLEADLERASAVCSISGTAPSVDHGRSLVNAMTCPAGTNDVLGVTAVELAAHPAHQGDDLRARLELAAGCGLDDAGCLDSGDAREGARVRLAPCRKCSSDRLSPNAFTRMSTQPGFGVGMGTSRICRTSGAPGPSTTTARIVRAHAVASVPRSFRCRRTSSSRRVSARARRRAGPRAARLLLRPRRSRLPSRTSALRRASAR